MPEIKADQIPTAQPNLKDRLISGIRAEKEDVDWLTKEVAPAAAEKIGKAVRELGADAEYIYWNSDTVLLALKQKLERNGKNALTEAKKIADFVYHHPDQAIRRILAPGTLLLTLAACGPVEARPIEPPQAAPSIPAQTEIPTLPPLPTETSVPPTVTPTKIPTKTATPTEAPTQTETPEPTKVPTKVPTKTPEPIPTTIPKEIPAPVLLDTYDGSTNFHPTIDYANNLLTKSYYKNTVGEDTFSRFGVADKNMYERILRGEPVGNPVYREQAYMVDVTDSYVQNGKSYIEFKVGEQTVAIELGEDIHVFTNIRQNGKLRGLWFYEYGNYKIGEILTGDKFGLNADLAKKAIANSENPKNAPYNIGGSNKDVNGSNNHVYIFNGL